MSISTLRLILPDSRWEEQILLFREAFYPAPDGIPGTSGLSQAASVTDWLESLNEMAATSRVPAGLVRGLQFILIDGSEIVGMLNLRTALNDYLENFGGHIGYAIRPDVQNRGYGRKMLKLGLVFAQAEGLKRVLITCDDQNQASAAVIEACGGRLEDKRINPETKHLVRRYWVLI